MLNILESFENMFIVVLNGFIVRIEIIIRKIYEYFRLGNCIKFLVSYLFYFENFIIDFS